MIQGDVYDAQVGSSDGRFSLLPPYTFLQEFDDNVHGFDILGRWTRFTAPGETLSVQAYFDLASREFESGIIETQIFDFDYQQDWNVFENSQIVWGLGYRSVWDEITNNFIFSLSDNFRQTNLVTGFVQGDAMFLEGALKVVVGTKLEYNDYTGFEIQPNARIALSRGDITYWASVSRAVRTPSRSESSIEMFCLDVMAPFSAGNPGPLPNDVFFTGNPDLVAEELIAYEGGVRGSLTSALSFDIAAFYNSYDSLISAASPLPPVFMPLPVPHIATVLPVDNSGEVDTFGAEAVLQIQATPWWRISATYAFIEDDIAGIDLAAAANGVGAQASPKHQAGLRSSMDFENNISLDLWPRYVGAIPGLGV